MFLRVDTADVRRSLCVCAGLPLLISFCQAPLSTCTPKSPLVVIHSITQPRKMSPQEGRAQRQRDKDAQGKVVLVWTLTNGAGTARGSVICSLTPSSCSSSRNSLGAHCLSSLLSELMGNKRVFKACHYTVHWLISLYCWNQSVQLTWFGSTVPSGRASIESGTLDEKLVSDWRNFC